MGIDRGEDGLNSFLYVHFMQQLARHAVLIERAIIYKVYQACRGYESGNVAEEKVARHAVLIERAIIYKVYQACRGYESGNVAEEKVARHAILI
jgi:hypothetical protein